MNNRVCLNLLACSIGLALAAVTPLQAAAAAPMSGVEKGALIEASDSGRYLVSFEEPGLLHYHGGNSGLAATAPAATGARKLDVDSAPARAYARHLQSQRGARLATIEQALGRRLEVRHAYGIYRNGLSASMSLHEAQRVARLPGVVSVRPVRRLAPGTFRGPTFVGADAVWSGTGVAATRGQGIRIGVIDTGANRAHPSFADDAGCGFDAANPKLRAFDCNASSAGHCDGPNPEAGVLGEGDGLGHGVHTASTAAGNTLDLGATPPPALPEGTSMSGVAPCAAVYSYKVANDTDGGIYDDSIAAAIESLAVDQIDVANYSIGPTCGGGSPWQDIDDRNFLDAVAADVFVAASAGNTRQSCQDPVGLVSHLGPWITTVAASTHDRLLAPARFALTGPGMPPAELRGIGVVPAGEVNLAAVADLAGTPIRTYPANLAGCSETGAFPSGYFAGAVALIRRGATPPATTACSFVEKAANAAAAGARLVLIANDRDDATVMSAPGAAVALFKINSPLVSDALIEFVEANQGVPVEGRVFADGFDGATAVAGAVGDFVKASAIAGRPGDVLADFSFRGPTPDPYSGLTKPDVSAPGVDIYAAGRAQDGDYFLMSGTSMASPHVAGAAALLRALHPDWSVSEVKSALQTTAVDGGTQEDGATPWNADQVGSGRIDVGRAARAALTLEETYENYLAADPSGGTLDPKALNLASLRELKCAPECRWTRTLRNRLGGTGSWTATAQMPPGVEVTISPATFSADAGATQTLDIAVKPTRTLGAPTFGRIVFKEANGLAPDQHFTLVVGNEPGIGVGCRTSACEFRLDTLAIDYQILANDAEFVWLNRFTPAPTDFPITIRSITTLIDMQVAGNDEGDRIPVHVYQDDDSDPSNGATLVGSYIDFALPAPGPVPVFTTIELPTPIVVDGPGDVLIALSNMRTTRNATRSITADRGPFKDRSWIGSLYDAPPGAVPGLGESDVGLRLANQPGWGGSVQGNWIIRASGSNAAGKAIELGVTGEPAGP